MEEWVCSSEWEKMRGRKNAIAPLRVSSFIPSTPQNSDLFGAICHVHKIAALAIKRCALCTYPLFLKHLPNFHKLFFPCLPQSWILLKVALMPMISGHSPLQPFNKPFISGKNKIGWSELKIKLPQSLDVDPDQLRHVCLSERIRQMDCWWPSLPSPNPSSPKYYSHPVEAMWQPDPSLPCTQSIRLHFHVQNGHPGYPCSLCCLLQMLRFSEASLWARDSMDKVWGRGQKTGWMCIIQGLSNGVVFIFLFTLC